MGVALIPTTFGLGGVALGGGGASKPAASRTLSGFVASVNGLHLERAAAVARYSEALKGLVASADRAWVRQHRGHVRVGSGSHLVGLLSVVLDDGKPKIGSFRIVCHSAMVFRTLLGWVFWSLLAATPNVRETGVFRHPNSPLFDRARLGLVGGHDRQILVWRSCGLRRKWRGCEVWLFSGESVLGVLQFLRSRSRQVSTGRRIVALILGQPPLTISTRPGPNTIPN